MQYTANQRLGKWGIPGTFPTGEVKERLQEYYASGNWTREKVNQFYDSYRDAVKIHGQPIYDRGQVGVKYFIEQNTNYPLDEITAFLQTIYDLSAEGKIDSRFWDINQQKDLIPDVGGNLENILKNVKWIGVLAIVGVGIYFAWPFLKRATRSR